MFYDLTSPDRGVLEQLSDILGKAEAGLDPTVFRIASASSQIYQMLDITGQLPPCQVELRERGLLVHFRSGGQSLAWAVPYWQVSIQHNDGKLSLFAGQHQLRLEQPQGERVDRLYIARLYERIASSTGQDHDIYGGQP
ncbi:MAG: hypothetical protein R3301_16310 [Saprospiraceae bacterium]|nr:hypothetical protein [Saprospiraceae bacterium]